MGISQVCVNKILQITELASDAQINRGNSLKRSLHGHSLVRRTNNSQNIVAIPSNSGPNRRKLIASTPSTLVEFHRESNLILVTVKMKGCCSLPTLAIIIGVLQGLCHLAVGVVSIDTIVKFSTFANDLAKTVTIENSVVLAFSLLASVFCVTMIVGVAKKRYLLILPYLLIGILGMVLYASMQLIIMSVVLSAMEELPIFAILVVVAKIALGVGLQTLLLYPSYTLYKEWRSDALSEISGLQNFYATNPIYFNIGTEK
ncbi:uncharacterized protein LOC142240065 [Haematobia irritans]|uniref:uncharacterized protein LOC142240065 n=1 Tax=Haematobia irritans TaxID=7368 RepID=UPI003F507381